MAVWESTAWLIVALLSIAQVLKSHQLKSAQNRHGTHPKWITFGDREYKIFSNKMTWEEAEDQCKEIDAGLATMDKDTVKKLGRHLLIGRPSLETAWIAAADGQGRRDGSDDCPIIVQHNGGVGRYKTAACSGSRAYICHRRTLGRKNGESAEIGESTHAGWITFRGDADSCGESTANLGHRRSLSARKLNWSTLPSSNGIVYKVHYKTVPWSEAKAQCDTFKEYGGKLMEPRSKKMLNDLISIMAAEEYEIQHLWLGGIHKSGKWYWLSDNAEITNLDIMDSPSRGTSSSELDDYSCLNVDNENFNQSIFYGTECAYPQSFVCTIPASRYHEYRRDEKNKYKLRRIRTAAKANRKRSKQSKTK